MAVVLSMFFVSVFFCFAETEINNVNSSANAELSVAENKVERSESDFKLNFDGYSDEDAENVKGPNGFLIFLRMILVLAFIVILIYLLFRFMKKSVSPELSRDEKFLRRVASVSVGPGKSVQIVTLWDKAYLVGVSDNNVNLIKELEDKELINAMNLYADKTDKVSRPKSFEEILEIFMPNLNKEKKNATNEENSSVSTDDLIASLKKKHMQSED